MFCANMKVNVKVNVNVNVCMHSKGCGVVTYREEKKDREGKKREERQSWKVG